MIDRTKRCRRDGAGIGISGIALPGLAVSALVLLCAPAHAQSSLSQQLGHPQVRQDDNAKPKPAPPPALPGSKSAEDTVAPADKLPSDMGPNEALFDAINRGDLAGAKDALNRGADLEARNILGQTPIDLSIDVGRNDITFLLLSMRNGDQRQGPPGPAPTAVAQGRVRPAPAAPRAPRQAVVVTKAAPPQQPQLFAGNGGAPVPQAGFLGFNGTR